MKNYLVAYGATAVSFLALDAAWLSIMGSRLYKPVLQSILAPRPNLAPAVVFYVLYVLGMIIFAVAPGLAAGRWTATLWRGALFGMFTYMTYDLTSQSVLRVWSTSITLADIGWGMVASAIAASIGCAAVLALR
jgi:uncharacterized membrane protein